MDLVVAYVSVCPFFGNDSTAHVLQLSSFVWETPVFVVESHDAVQIQNRKLK